MAPSTLGGGFATPISCPARTLPSGRTFSDVLLPAPALMFIRAASVVRTRTSGAGTCPARMLACADTHMLVDKGKGVPLTATRVDPGAQGRPRLHPEVRYALALAMLSSRSWVFLPTRWASLAVVGAALSRNTAECASMAGPCVDASSAPLLPTTAHVVHEYRLTTSAPNASRHTRTSLRALRMLARILGVRQPRCFTAPPRPTPPRFSLLPPALLSMPLTLPPLPPSLPLPPLPLSPSPSPSLPPSPPPTSLASSFSA
mmetsp:Transcript_25015/g.62497  ORF Transcript_25015/g.62497 Transcript_25015/m.62497 type:complete len:259 (-) Transcript_25015:521-1297(-)